MSPDIDAEIGVYDGTIHLTSSGKSKKTYAKPMSVVLTVAPSGLPPDPGEVGKTTLEGIDSDGDGRGDACEGEPPTVDKRADVDPSAQIGDGTEIVHGATVRENAVIGAGVLVSRNVDVGAGCQIGDNVFIDQNAILGENCSIGDNSFIG